MEMMQGFWTTLTSSWGWLTWLLGGSILILVFGGLALVFAPKAVEAIAGPLARALEPILVAVGETLGKLLVALREKLGELAEVLWDALKFWAADVSDNMKSFLMTILLGGALAWSMYGCGRIEGRRQVIEEVGEPGAAGAGLWATCKPVIAELHKTYRFTLRPGRTE